jgi:hypothetical protein
MGFGWEAQQTGKSTGGKGKAAGLYRGGFSAVHASNKAVEFGLSFFKPEL